METAKDIEASSPALTLDVNTKAAGAMARLKEHLLSLQHRDGYWVGKVEDNVTITAEYLMFLHFLGIVDADVEKRAVNYILSVQNDDGGWSIYNGGPSELSATVEAYFALKLAGFSKDHPALKRARAAIENCGGIEKIRVFTKINLALFGQFPWKEIPVIQPEIMLLPKSAPINIYEFSSWSRSTIVPLLVIFNAKPVKDIPSERGVGELFEGVEDYKNFKCPQTKGFVSWETFFNKLNSVLKIYESIPLKPFRKAAIEQAIRWTLGHQDKSGYWGGIFPAMVNSILAMYLYGYPLSHPRIQRGLWALRQFADEGPDYFRMQSTVSVIWDTGLSIIALRDAGLDKRDPRLQRAARWVMRKQIEQWGDWQVKNTESEPGGWAFEFENDYFPDNDDTAIVMQALMRMDLEADNAEKADRIRLGLQWLLGMQCSDGGWGAFDKDNNMEVLNEIPFADLKALLDPSTPDMVGHILETLGQMGYRLDFDPVARGVEFLRSHQERDGSFFGRWGVNYIFGTSAVLVGLKNIKFSMDDPMVLSAVSFLKSIQNPDGGFGESCESYHCNKYVPLGYSTPSQTAWAVMGLLAAVGPDDDAVKRGILYLSSKVDESGDVYERDWTATGFPRHFMLRYDYYRLYFPLMALARYIRAVEK